MQERIHKSDLLPDLRHTAQHTGFLMFKIAMRFQSGLHGASRPMQTDLDVSRRHARIACNFGRCLIEHVGLRQHLTLRRRQLRQQILDAARHLLTFKRLLVYSIRDDVWQISTVPGATNRASLAAA
jgi:hypothetical protein